jgi:probable O-glycosylation ligase (exosortase A-associated)
MGIRDVIVLLFVSASLPLAFRRPFYGLLLFSVISYMRLQDLTWALRNARLAFASGAALFAGFFLFEWGKRRFWIPDSRMRVLLVLFALVGLSVLLPAEANEVSVAQFFQFAKIVAVALVTTSLVDTRERVRVLLLVIALSLGFFGFKGGAASLVTRQPILRGPGGFIQDNNDFSLALVMAFPFLYLLGMKEEDRRLRIGLLFSAFGTVLTIALTHSRGGALAFAACLGGMILTSRRRALGITAVIVGLLLLLPLLPSSVWERLASIREYEKDSSAMARLHAWGVALDMIRDRPLLGVGFWNFQVASPRYDPTLTVLPTGETEAIVAHNSYLQIWAETGTPAFLLYLFLLASTWWAVRRVRREALRRDGPPWIVLTARAFEAAFAGFLVGATFLNRGHFDLYYHLVATAVAFMHVARRELSSVPASRLVPVEVPRAPRKRGGFRPIEARLPRPGFRPGTA